MSPVTFPLHLSEKEAAAYLGVSLSTVRRWRRGKIGPAYYRVGDVLRYARGGLDAFIAKNTHTAEQRG